MYISITPLTKTAHNSTALSGKGPNKLGVTHIRKINRTTLQIALRKSNVNDSFYETRPRKGEQI